MFDEDCLSSQVNVCTGKMSQALDLSLEMLCYVCLSDDVVLMCPFEIAML